MIALLVDDDRVVRMLWRRTVEQITSDIREATTLAEAFEMMERIPHPDLVLLDLRMPGTTWENTLAHIRKLKAINPDVVVIVISGLSEHNIDLMALEHGADAFADKLDVVSQRKLLAAIRPTLEGKQNFKDTLSLFEKLTKIVTYGIACVPAFF